MKAQIGFYITELPILIFFDIIPNLGQPRYAGVSMQLHIVQEILRR